MVEVCKIGVEAGSHFFALKRPGGCIDCDFGLSLGHVENAVIGCKGRIVINVILDFVTNEGNVGA